MTWLDQLLDEPRGPITTDTALEAITAGLPPDDARALREERAGILEYDAGFTQEEAERRAGLAPSSVAGRVA